MRLLGLATALYNRPLLVTPDRAAEIERAYRLHENADGRAALLAPAVEHPTPRHELATPGGSRTDAGYYRTADGVAIISVVGTLVQRGDSMDAMSGLLSYGRIASMLQAALDDPRTDTILLEIDSPGGEANGLMDLAAKVKAAGAKKPVHAIALEQAFSAAYWLATSASKIYTPQTGMVGSIGVVMLHVDQSGRDAKQGIVYTPIFAGAHKVDFSSHAPLSDDAKAIAQDEVDRLYGMFVQAVADGRGVDPQVVRDTEAGLLNPQAAEDAGLIDGVASFDETLAALAAEAKQSRYRGMRAAAAALLVEDGRDVSHFSPLNDERIDMAETSKAPTFSADEVEKARAEARAEAESKAKAERDQAASGAAKAAQERVAGILGHAEAQGRRTLAEHIAFKTTTSLEDAVALLAASPKDAPTKPANPLADAMAVVPNPKVGIDADKDAKVAAPIAANVYAFRRECVAKARAGR